MSRDAEETKEKPGLVLFFQSMTCPVIELYVMHHVCRGESQVLARIMSSNEEIVLEPMLEPRTT